MTTGMWIAVLAVLVALAFGGYRALTNGRFRPSARPAAPAGRATAAAASTPADPAAPVGRVARPATAERAETNTVASTWATLAAPAGVAPGERATLVQFSSAFCAPCRATRRVLADVAETVPGVVHVELDAEHHLDVVRRLNILRTPTTLVLDAEGNEVARASGAPHKQQVLGALP